MHWSTLTKQVLAILLAFTVDILAIVCNNIMTLRKNLISSFVFMPNIAFYITLDNNILLEIKLQAKSVTPFSIKISL